MGVLPVFSNWFKHATCFWCYIVFLRVSKPSSTNNHAHENAQRWYRLFTKMSGNWLISRHAYSCAHIFYKLSEPFKHEYKNTNVDSKHRGKSPLLWREPFKISRRFLGKKSLNKFSVQTLRTYKMENPVTFAVHIKGWSFPGPELNLSWPAIQDYFGLSIPEMRIPR